LVSIFSVWIGANDDFEKVRPSWGHVNHVVGALFIAEAMIVKKLP